MPHGRAPFQPELPSSRHAGLFTACVTSATLETSAAAQGKDRHREQWQSNTAHSRGTYSGSSCMAQTLRSAGVLLNSPNLDLSSQTFGTEPVCPLSAFQRVWQTEAPNQSCSALLRHEVSYFGSRAGFLFADERGQPVLLYHTMLLKV